MTDVPLFPEYLNPSADEPLDETQPSLDPELHAYTSTACHHDLHDRCRTACKFCGRLCDCACHDEESVHRARWPT